MSISKILKAFATPILPLVPSCTYCSAMRWALIGSVISGTISTHIFWGFIKGVVVGVVLIAGIYYLYRKDENA